VKQISPKCLPWQAHFHKPTVTCDIGHPSSCLTIWFVYPVLIKKEDEEAAAEEEEAEGKEIKGETMLLRKKINLIHNSVLTSIILTNNIIKRYDLSVPVPKVKNNGTFLCDKHTEQTYMNTFNFIICQNSYNVKLLTWMTQFKVC
jgi:hypothetical protein